MDTMGQSWMGLQRPPEPVLGEETGLVGVQISICYVALGLISNQLDVLLSLAPGLLKMLPVNTQPRFSSELPLPYSEGL